MRLSKALGLAVCCVLFLGAGTAFGNLVTNGDFEMGGVGFGTQYATPFGVNTASGQLTLTTMPSAWNASFANPAGSQGQFLVANGSTDVFNRVWYTELSDIVAGQEYNVSFDATTLSGSSNPARLGFYVALNPSDPIAATNVTTLTLPGTDTWTNISGSFIASHSTDPNDPATYIKVFISDLTNSVSGNDFGVDNISVTVVPEPSSLALLGIGSLVGLGVYTRRRRKNA